MQATEADDAAIRAVRAGDREAFARLVTLHGERAFRAAFLILRDAAAAEDATQEGLIRAYQSLDRFRLGDPFGAWLVRIVVNVALNEVRSRQRRLSWLPRLWAGAPRSLPGPASAVAAGERRAELHEAMAELSEQDRVALYLRYYLGLNEREMATALGCAQGTVKSRLSRASQRLRALIEARYPHLREPFGDEEGDDG
ncbi:MAG: RNA polymerase sigma factor [Dehalococcoidia bacterium]